MATGSRLRVCWTRLRVRLVVTPRRTPRTPKPVTPLDASPTPSARKRGPDGEAGSSRGPGKTPRKALFTKKRQSGVAELMGDALDVVAADRARKAAAGDGSGPGGAGDQQQTSTSAAETTVTRSETVPVGLGSLSDQTQTVPVPSGLQQSVTLGDLAGTVSESTTVNPPGSGAREGVVPLATQEALTDDLLSPTRPGDAPADTSDSAEAETPRRRFTPIVWGK